VSTSTASASASRLGALARQAREVEQASAERCELCGEPIAAEHRHLVDTRTRALLCACRACSLLFDRGAAGGGHLRLVPQRRVRLDGFRLDEAAWATLQLPVETAFLFESSAAGRVVAFYPSPVGATESLLELSAWEALRAGNPILDTLAPDTEALLVHRARRAREHWIVPIDDCYALVGLIRLHWRGLTGGAEVWREIERFFTTLAAKARPADRQAIKEAR
jgi:Family of unknown function (DUF5947)